MSTERPPTSGATPRLALTDVTVRFGGMVALDSVSLAVGEREVVGLIGPNGAGKTTLFNVVCGLVTPSAGEVRLGGSRRPLAPHRLTAAGVARTLQGLGLFAGLTARQNVMAGLSTRAPGVFRSSLGTPGSDQHARHAAARADETLRTLDILDTADRLPDSLPYPVRKRVALARALVSEPTLLLLDEPAGGLGSDDIAALATLVRQLATTRDCTIVLVEHHVDFVMGVCDRVAVLDFGRLIADGSPEEVRRTPAVIEAYLGIDTPAHRTQAAAASEATS
ncbi:ABC transporter ATP-binding protein [Sanguibacter sp. 25GB23B1]|uniref:ABC transporter ATP-binding protein n=1 Tax=unclassified Sanguibacter TaxID=2645534 RepID=UPI0032AFD731